MSMPIRLTDEVLLRAGVNYDIRKAATYICLAQEYNMCKKPINAILKLRASIELISTASELLYTLCSKEELAILAEKDNKEKPKDDTQPGSKSSKGKAE